MKKIEQNKKLYRIRPWTQKKQLILCNELPNSKLQNYKTLEKLKFYSTSP